MMLLSTSVLLNTVPEEQESQDPSQSGKVRGTKRSRADEDTEIADSLAETGENGEQEQPCLQK